MINNKLDFSIHGDTKSQKCVVVVADSLPSLLEHDERRLILINQIDDIQEALNYHQTAFKKLKWLDAIYISTAHLSYRTFNHFRKYKNVPFFSGCGEQIISLAGRKLFDGESDFDYFLSVYSVLSQYNVSKLCLSRALLRTRASVKDKWNSDDIEQAISIFLDIPLSDASNLLRQASDSFVLDVVEQSLEFSKDCSDPDHFTYCCEDFNGLNSLTIQYLNPLRGHGRGKLWHRIPDLMLLKAGTGSGKTELALDATVHAQRIGKKVAIISNIRMVVKSYDARLQDKLRKRKTFNPQAPMFKITTSDASLYEVETSDHISTTLKSLTKPHVLHAIKSSDMIIFDEAEKVLETLYSKHENFIKHQEKSAIRKLLSELLNSSNKKIIFMDADISNSVTKRIIKEYLYTDKKVLLAMAYNSCKKHDFSNINVSISNGENEAYLLVEKIRNGSKNNYVFSSSKRKIDSILNLLGFRCLDNDQIDYIAALDNGVLVVIAEEFLKGKHKKAVDKFIHDPNKEIMSYHTIICSPVIKEGFSIEADFSDTVTCLYDKILTPKEMVQSARRLRGATNIRFGVFNNSKIVSVDNSKYNQTKEDYLESELDFRRKVLIDNAYQALKLTLAKLDFNIVDDSYNASHNNEKGRERLKLTNDSYFNPNIAKAILQGEISGKLMSSWEKTEHDAILSLRKALRISAANKTIIVANKDVKRECDGLYIDVYNELYECRKLINNILPNNIKIIEDKPSKLTGIMLTRRVKSIYKALNYKAKRGSGGAVTIFEHQG